jgi:predicted DNA-binding protein
LNIGGLKMSKKMTVVFKDENVYTHLKVEAAKRSINASDIVSEAVVEWIESQEDFELAPLIKNAQKEAKSTGTKPWKEIKKSL